MIGDRDRYVLQARPMPINANAGHHIAKWGNEKTFLFASDAISDANWLNKHRGHYEYRVVERMFGEKGKVVGHNMIVPEMWPPPIRTYNSLP